MRRGCCPDTPGKPDALLQHLHETRRLGPQDRVALTIEPGERIVVPGSTASSTLMELDAESPSTKGSSRWVPRREMNTFLRTRDEGRSLTRARSSPWCHSSSYGPKLGRSARFGERTAIGAKCHRGDWLGLAGQRHRESLRGRTPRTSQRSARVSSTGRGCSAGHRLRSPKSFGVATSRRSLCPTLPASRGCGGKRWLHVLAPWLVSERWSLGAPASEGA
jgi:hypothetical protein